MNIQNIAASNSTARKFSQLEECQSDSTSNLDYVRSSSKAPVVEKIDLAGLRNSRADRAGGATFYRGTSLADLKKKATIAAVHLDQRMLPGDSIDLGKLIPAGKGYLCRKTAEGDGYIVQSHEQAKSASSNGLFFPTVKNSNVDITMDTMPVTDVNQLSSDMYQLLHAISRFVERIPMSQLLISI